MIFELTPEQVEIAKQWKDSHHCFLRQDNGEIYTRAIGGNFTYSFTPTGIGTGVSLKCSCGKDIDLTDYENW